MRHPFLLPCLVFIAGIVFENRIPFSLFQCLSLILGLLPLTWFARGTKAFRPVFLITLFLAAVLNYRLLLTPPRGDIAHLKLDPDAHYAVTGIVDGSVRYKTEGRSTKQTFPLKVNSIRLSGRTISAQGRIQCIVIQARKQVQYGDVLRLWGKISRPHEATNPGEFDYASYLSRQGISLQMSVLGEGSVKILGTASSNSVWIWIERIRNLIANRFDELFEKIEAAILNALIVGERKDLPFRIQEGFSNTGTIHVLSISGLHIAMVGGCWYAFWRLIGIPQRLNAFISAFVILVYMQIAGLKVPVVRSALMGTLFYAAVVFKTQQKGLNTLSLAALILLAVNARWLQNISFQLSFLCVLSIILFAPTIERMLRGFPLMFVRRSLSVSIATALGAQMVVCFYFSTITPISLVANILIVPLITLITVCGFIVLPLSYVPVLSEWSVDFLEWLIRFTLFLNEQISHIPFAYWYVPKPPLVFVLAYYFILAILWLLLPWLTKKRFGLTAISFAAVAILITGLIHNPQSQLSVTALNVKQVGIYLIRTAEGKHILINCGSANKPDIGRWTTIPFLKSRGIRALDAVILTGWGKRNWGALADLNYFFRMPYCLLPGRGSKHDDFPTQLKGIELKNVRSGAAITGFDSLELRASSSGKGETALLLSYQNRKIVIVGALDEQLLDNLTESLHDIDVIFLSNRRGQFSERVLRFLIDQKPKLVVVSGTESLGAKSGEAANFPIYFTAAEGAVEVEFSSTHLKIKPFLGRSHKIDT